MQDFVHQPYQPEVIVDRDYKPYSATMLGVLLHKCNFAQCPQLSSSLGSQISLKGLGFRLADGWLG